MSDQQFQVYLSCGMLVCAVMTVVSLLRVRSRGPRSYCLALGFVAMGFLLNGFRMKWPGATLGDIGVALVLCLIGDFILRSRERQDKP